MVTLRKIYSVLEPFKHVWVSSSCGYQKDLKSYLPVLHVKLHSCYLQTFLKERFDNEEIKPDLWMSLEGGNTCTECGILAEDTTLYFGGATVRQAVTQDLDLRGAK